MPARAPGPRNLSPMGRDSVRIVSVRAPVDRDAPTHPERARPSRFLAFLGATEIVVSEASGSGSGHSDPTVTIDPIRNSSCSSAPFTLNG